MVADSTTTASETAGILNSTLRIHSSLDKEVVHGYRGAMHVRLTPRVCKGSKVCVVSNYMPATDHGLRNLECDSGCDYMTETSVDYVAGCLGEFRKACKHVCEYGSYNIRNQ